MNVVIPIITFVVGAVAGFAVGVFYLKGNFPVCHPIRNRYNKWLDKWG